ncbi:MAG: hypothetical protein OXC05_06965 [Halieaceae bacterium]|nr:hypothetical protein [Halieaceae bacterium]
MTKSFLKVFLSSSVASVALPIIAEQPEEATWPELLERLKGANVIDQIATDDLGDAAEANYLFMSLRWMGYSSSPQPDVEEVALSDVAHKLSSLAEKVTPEQRKKQL